MLVLNLGFGLRGLVLAKNSRPKSRQTTKFTINFHRLEHGDWSELYFKIHVPYLLTVGNRGLVRAGLLEKKQDFISFYRNLLHYEMALALSVNITDSRSTNVVDFGTNRNRKRVCDFISSY